MAIITLTLAEHEDRLGLPIVMFVALDHATHTYMSFRLRDLPADGIAVVLAWLNARIST